MEPDVEDEYGGHLPSESLFPLQLTPSEIAAKNSTALGPFVHNMVTKINTDGRIPTALVAWTHFGSYTHSDYRGRVYVRMATPAYASVLMFPSGKIIITGTKTLQSTIGCLVELLCSIGLKANTLLRPVSVKVKNIQGTMNMPYTIHLAALASYLKTATYDKRNFPGVIYKITLTAASTGDELKITYLIFDSGKLVVTGATDTEVLKKATEIITPALALFSVKPVDPEVIARDNRLAMEKRAEVKARKQKNICRKFGLLKLG